jgi:hypothetical protein
MLLQKGCVFVEETGMWINEAEHSVVGPNTPDSKLEALRAVRTVIVIVKCMHLRQKGGEPGLGLEPSTANAGWWHAPYTPIYRVWMNDPLRHEYLLQPWRHEALPLQKAYTCPNTLAEGYLLVCKACAQTFDALKQIPTIASNPKEWANSIWNYARTTLRSQLDDLRELLAPALASA